MYSPDQVPTSWLRSAGVPSRRMEGTVAAQADEVSATASANATTRARLMRHEQVPIGGQTAGLLPHLEIVGSVGESAGRAGRE